MYSAQEFKDRVEIDGLEYTLLHGMDVEDIDNYTIRSRAVKAKNALIELVLVAELEEE
jgi:hypothetical protein